ncbi:YdcH family protein [Candidatus Paracaedibacter symbiosus]|uniref:YdcH family protein n=1 Tax=Candidatus Paracaedibacter symbiosus TaxID=244582 RepID=UPI000509ED66|nr:DUF465 domain-containing protein [Candidatus Paracaedibacter symbiosus]
MALDPEAVIKLQHELDRLRKHHKDLDKEIDSLSQGSLTDDLRVHRLKREKLYIKDLMLKIEALFVPNIIA